jgi:hypothetical protein
MILPKFIAYDSTEGIRRRGLDEALFARAKDVGEEIMVANSRNS